MKNRVKLLSIQKGIFTPIELAHKLGVSELKMNRIWEEKEIIEHELVESLAKFFGCSTAYLLCLCERVK